MSLFNINPGPIMTICSTAMDRLNTMMFKKKGTTAKHKENITCPLCKGQFVHEYDIPNSGSGETDFTKTPGKDGDITPWPK